MADTHFARLLTTKQVREVEILLLREFGARAEADAPDGDAGFLQVKAPDGDVVFAAMPKSADGPWLCRFHRDVFDPETTAGRNDI